MQKKVKVLNIPFINTTRKDLIQNIIKPALENRQKRFIVTANPEIVEYANNHPEYKDILDQADVIAPDGIGIIIASKMIKQPLQERVAGFDIMHDMFEIANEKGLKVYMLGAEKSVIEKAAENVKRQYPSLRLVGYHHGFIDINEREIAERIAQLKPDIILTALGFPRQEQWIHKYISIFPKGLFMGVGGSFDILAGKLNRAPVIWQKLNLEWLYRLIKQPSRWRRMLVLPLFILHVAKGRKQ
ncbi:WecB/TagA/CpsF family glycosyltransferase [Peribacillus sp. SCS-155]|uniref:WecB/TagA/CpsF family glycosyltransferase n=1 Tax=Peribacillus sedimenti TaxID=3115297 RepID=UPI003906473C